MDGSPVISFQKIQFRKGQIHVACFSFLLWGIGQNSTTKESQLLVLVSIYHFGCLCLTTTLICESSQFALCASFRALSVPGARRSCPLSSCLMSKGPQSALARGVKSVVHPRYVRPYFKGESGP